MIMVIRDPGVFYRAARLQSVVGAEQDAPQLPRNDSFCHASPELPSLGNRRVPFYMPGTNPAIKETIENYGLPEEAMRGGAEMIIRKSEADETNRLKPRFAANADATTRFRRRHHALTSQRSRDTTMRTHISMLSVIAVLRHSRRSSRNSGGRHGIGRLAR